MTHEGPFQPSAARKHWSERGEVHSTTAGRPATAGRPISALKDQPPFPPGAGQGLEPSVLLKLLYRWVTVNPTAG